MELKGFLKAGHKPTLAMSFLYFDVSFMIWVLLGALGIFIGKEFGLTSTQKGLMTAIPILGGALMRIPMGLLTERMGAKKTGMFGMILTLVPLVWGWLFCKSYGDVLSFGILLGVAGGSFAVALPLASRWYPAKYQGLAMGIAGAGNSGTLLATLFAPRLAEAYGWNTVFGIAIIPLVVTFVLFSLFAKESPNKPPAMKVSEYFAVIRESDALCFCFLYAITFGGFVGLASFLSIFFNDQYGLSRVRAGDFTTMCIFAGSMFRALGGYLSDRFGGIRLLSGIYLAVGVLMFAVATLPTLYVVTAFLFLAMLALGMGNGAVFQLVPLRFGKQIGIITGLVGAAGGFGGFMLPSMFGMLKDATGSYAGGFAGFGLAALTGAVILVAVQKAWTDSWVGAGGRAIQEASGGFVHSGRRFWLEAHDIAYHVTDDSGV